jgi:tetratricopeptide (TPR) repeat protein
MKVFIRFFVLALISGLSVVTYAQTATERNAEKLKLAQELVETGHKTEALSELNKIASSDAFDPIGFYNLGNAFARLGESQSAIDAYRHAIEQRHGNYSRAYNNLGVVLLREGRWDEAYEALNAALKIESFHYAEASYNLGRVYAARGQYDLAAREWKRALLVDPKHTAAAEALARLGSEERVVVEKPSAKSVAKTAVTEKPASLTLDPESFDWLQRARSASERGKMTEAVDNFQRVLSRQHGYFAPANLELSYALLSLKRYDEALGNLLQVSQRDGSRYPISYFHLARVYEIKGDLKQAEAAFSQAVNAYVPANMTFLLDLSRVREKQGDFKGALNAMEQYVAAVQQQGQKPAWCDERLAELRLKVK